MVGYEDTIATQQIGFATSFGRVQSFSRVWPGPIDYLSAARDGHWLQFTSPRPRAAVACFPGRWNSHRFEQVGEVFFVPTGEAFRARSNCRRQRSIACLLSPHAMEECLGIRLECDDHRLRAGLNIINPTLRHLLFRVGEEIRHPGFASQVLLDTMCVEIAVELCRHFRRLDEEREPSGGLAPWRLKLIEERLSAVDRAPALHELAQLCHLSVRQLTRCFRASRGCSIGEYAVGVRIEHAMRLLRLQKCVKEVAHALGFTSPSNFTTAFHHATGQTPRQFQRGDSEP
jgi:AraC family transcriptional regulator